MDIILGTTTDDKNVINKAFTEKYTVNAIIKQDTSIINPTFILSYEGELDINYIYVESLKRYYYINDITILSGGRYALSCHVDVLNSHKKDIIKETAILDKVEQIGLANKFINDNSWGTTSKEFNQVYNFPDGFSTYPKYVFISVGGV